MKTINTILVGGIATAAQIANASSEMNLSLKDLNQIGLNPEAIQELYRQQADISLDWNEVLKVSANDEGQEVNIKTIDGISVVVPIDLAITPENKVDIPSPRESSSWK